MIRIAQASSSENYGKYGDPPNQRRTGVTNTKPAGNMDGELNISAYHTGFTAVFRCTDEAVADKAATFVEHAVANWNHIGYSWETKAHPMGEMFDIMMGMTDPDPKNIKKLTNVTCCTLIAHCFYFAGIYEPKFRTLNTANQEKVFLGTGKFIKLTDPDLVKSGRGIKRGDVLWRNGHTAIVLDSDPRSIMIPYRTANCAYCNLRSGPSVNDQVIETLPAGVPVFYISTSDNGWGQVNHDGKIGFISDMYLEPLPTMKVNGNDCWLRSTAGTTGKQLIVMPKGASVGVTGKTKKILGTVWRECMYASKSGWASGKYVF